MHDKSYDVIVIGGGMAGAHAAYRLVELGKRVLLLDGGITRARRAPETQLHFEHLRRSDRKQYEFFLGTQLEALKDTARASHAAAMISGNRTYVSARTDEFLPIYARETALLQSLAKGGLSEAWGGVCAILNDMELRDIGIDADMHEHYQAVIDLIGVSGQEHGFHTQPAALISKSAKRLKVRFDALGQQRRNGFQMRQPLLALTTEAHRGRSATQYLDLDYYASADTAIYRARHTLEELEMRENFEYTPGLVVERVVDMGGQHDVFARNFAGESRVFRGKRIVLAAGAINSNRIALVSGIQSTTTLFIKPNHIFACLDIHSLGKADESRRHSLCQLTIDREIAGASEIFAHVYAYKSLLLWKLKEQIPLPAPEALSLLALYAPSLFLVDARTPGTDSTCDVALSSDGTLSVQKRSSKPHAQELFALRKLLRSLGLFTMKIAHPPLGSSVHYAGGIKTSASGEIENFPNVFVADSASWHALPAKPLALTLMANARRVGEAVAKSI
ncbi:MAG TPA: FAD-dependent oxidoreductase [Candidatus Paceibacterota bacterium]|nr:FAD-dependent oxidoreductase [Candidatus Paceibacterota bacterium]